MEADRDPLLDAIDCAECNKEFIPKREGQTLCGRPACNGGIGARKRVYGKRRAAEARERVGSARKRTAKQ